MPERARESVPTRQSILPDTEKSVSAPAKPLAHYAALALPRDEAMVRAYATGDFTLAQVAQAFGVHCATVSRAVGRRV